MLTQNSKSINDFLGYMLAIVIFAVSATVCEITTRIYKNGIDSNLSLSKSGLRP